jgi:hypothetical protein
MNNYSPQNSLWQKIIIHAARAVVFLTLAAVVYAQAAYCFSADLPFAARRREALYSQSAPVARDAAELFGNIRLKSENKISLPEAVILINGRKAADFSSGEVLFRVYEGDAAVIDSSAYARDLVFYLEGCSANLNMNIPEGIVRTREGKGYLGKIRFK